MAFVVDCFLLLLSSVQKYMVLLLCCCEIFRSVVLCCSINIRLVYGNASVHKSGTKLVFMG